MNFHRYRLLIAGIVCLPFCGFAEGKNPSKREGPLGIVDFTTCYVESKYGKREQEHSEQIRQQINTMAEKTAKDLQRVSDKLEDEDYMENISAKAEEKLRKEKEGLEQDLARYRANFYQIMQQAQTQSAQKVFQKVAEVARDVAEEENYSYVINKDLCFYYAPGLDITPQVLSALDKNFSLEEEKELAEKEKEQAEEDVGEISKNGPVPMEEDYESDDFSYEDFYGMDDE